MGDADLKTTMAYTHLGREHLRALVEPAPANQAGARQVGYPWAYRVRNTRKRTQRHAGPRSPRVDGCNEIPSDAAAGTETPKPGVAGSIPAGPVSLSLRLLLTGPSVHRCSHPRGARVFASDSGPVLDPPKW